MPILSCILCTNPTTRWQDCGAGPHGTYHDKEGRPLVNKTRFPDMGKMVAAAHGKGVSMGW